MDLKSTPEALIHLRTVLDDAVKTILTPAPRLALSEWSNAHRVLSRETAPEAGKFRWQRIPYVREMLDVAGDYRTQKMVVMSSARVGKTTLLENVSAFYMAEDPCPILLMLPTKEMAQQF